MLNITDIENSARQLTSPGTDDSVVRNARSVLQVSQTLLRECPPPLPQNQAATELFMANNVEFDLQAQQRLLRNIVDNKPALIPAPIQDTISSETALDFEAYLACWRSNALRETSNRAREIVAKAQRDATDNIILRYEEQNSAELAEALSLQNLRLPILNRPNNALSRKNLDGTREAKIRAYASIIMSKDRNCWGQEFIRVAQEDIEVDFDTEKELANMWITSHAIVSSLHDGKMGILNVVSTSRGLLEEKYLFRLFKKTCGVPEGTFAEMCRMPTNKIYNIVCSYCGTTASFWEQVYVACRAGAYDVAQHIATNAGVDQLAQMLERITSLPLIERNSADVNIEISADLWGKKQSKINPQRWNKEECYQAGTLLILSGGGVAGNEISRRVFINNVVEMIAEDLEDILWLRFCLVRRSSDDPKHENSLESLQHMIVKDQQAILSMVNNRVIQLATLFIFLLLPNMAAQLLMSDEETFIDGVHLAILFNIPSRVPFSLWDIPINIGIVLRRYAISLLEQPRASAEFFKPAQAIIDYFGKNDREQDLIDFCQNPIIARKLFEEGNIKLKSDFFVKLPSDTYFKIAGAVARDAILRSNFNLAINIFLNIAKKADGINDCPRASKALCFATDALTAAMFRSIYSGRFDNIFSTANALQDALSNGSYDIPVAKLNALKYTQLIAMIHSLTKSGDEEGALKSVFSIPFIPRCVADVETCARKYDGEINSDELLAVMPQTVLLIMKLLQSSFYHRTTNFERDQIRDYAQALFLWVVRWRVTVPKSIFDEMAKIKKQITTIN